MITHLPAQRMLFWVLAFSVTTAACSEPSGASGNEGGADSAGSPSTARGGAASIAVGGASAGSADPLGDYLEACEKRPRETVSIDRVVFHAGLEVTLEEATLVAGTDACPSSDFVIDAVFYNRGTSPASFDSSLLLTSDENYYEGEVGDGAEAIPGERSLSGTLEFSVDTDFVFDEATLIIGAARNNRAIVPLGSSSLEPFVSLEPQDLSLSATVEARHILLSVTGGELTADSTNAHIAYEKGTLGLTLNYDATYLGGGGYFEIISDKSFLLTLPHGPNIAPEFADLVILENPGETVSGSAVTFLIPRPIAGEYSLRLTVLDSETREWVDFDVPFELQALPAFGPEP